VQTFIFQTHQGLAVNVIKQGTDWSKKIFKHIVGNVRLAYWA
jgi:hypothetical protein